MNAGKNYLDQGDATNALAVFKKAEAITPNDMDVRLNLANSYLLAGAAGEAIKEADEVLKLEPNSAAAYFIKGSACLRLLNWEGAVIALENAQKIDPSETSTFFQLGARGWNSNNGTKLSPPSRKGLRWIPTICAAQHIIY
jgi:tetratricopeptide (TPR) repeat protein